MSPCQPLGTLSLARALGAGAGRSPRFLGIRCSVSRPRWSGSCGCVWVSVWRFLVPLWGGPGRQHREGRVTEGDRGQRAVGAGRGGQVLGQAWAWPGPVSLSSQAGPLPLSPEDPGDEPARAWGPSPAVWGARGFLPGQHLPFRPGFLDPAGPGCSPSTLPSASPTGAPGTTRPHRSPWRPLHGAPRELGTVGSATPGRGARRSLGCLGFGVAPGQASQVGTQDAR